MANLITDVLGAAAAAGIQLTTYVTRLSSLSLGLNDILSSDGEKICKEVIKHAPIAYKDSPEVKGKKGIQPVSIDLQNIDGGVITFGISNSIKNKTIDIGSYSDVSLSYVGLLSTYDEGAGLQRFTIASVLYTLEYYGYKFSLAMGDSDSDNTASNKKVLIITAISNSRNRLNINKLLVAEGVCSYTTLGNNTFGDSDTLSKEEMYDLSAVSLRNRIEKDDPALTLELATQDAHMKNERMLSTIFNPNKKIEENKKLEEDFMHESSNTGMFKIGDTWLEIPPTHITISQMRNSYTVPLIGMESKPLSTPVNRTIIKINCVFTGDQVYGDLIRILTQFRYSPINMLRSKDLFYRVAGSESYLYRDYRHTHYIPVTMDQYTLFNVDGHPGTVSAVFQFSLFNYTGYVPDNNRAMEYYKENPAYALLMSTFKFGKEKVRKQLKGAAKSLTTLGKTETTWRLEEAAHPYNANIESKLAEIQKQLGKGGLFDMNNSNFSIHKVDMDRFFNATKGLKNEDISLDKEKNMSEFLDVCINSSPVFTEKAQSISVTYNNIFAWQPLLGQSQPLAQYVGPGETVVSINLKGIDMSDTYDTTGTELGVPEMVKVKRDQKLMSSLLKSWSEKYGTAQYGFFDDRYFIKATLLNLADVNIVSIQNTVCTSVESKPGLFDVNILFSKSMFEYNLRSNPVSAFDSYFGLRRMTALYEGDKNLEELTNKVNDKIAKAYKILSSRLASPLTLNGMNPGLRLALNNFFSKLKSEPEKVWHKDKIMIGGLKTKDIKFDSTKPVQAYVNNPNIYRCAAEIITSGYQNLVLHRIDDAFAMNIVWENKGVVKDSDYNNLKVNAWTPALPGQTREYISKNGGMISIEIESKNINLLKNIKSISIPTVWLVKELSEYKVTQDDVYNNLHISANGDSFNILPKDTGEEAEEKAKFSALGSIINQVIQAKIAGKPDIYPVPYTQEIWDNKEFLDQYYQIFLSSIGKYQGTYETLESSSFKSASIRQAFIKNILEPNKNKLKLSDPSSYVKSIYEAGKWIVSIDGKSDESLINNYHLMTKNAITLEYTNAAHNELADVSETKLATFGILGSSDAEKIALIITKKISDEIKSVCGDKLAISKAWEPDPKDKSKYYIMVYLNKSEKEDPEKNIEDMIKDTLSSKEDQDKLKALNKKGLAGSALKPFSAHRYYPFCEGFVSWSQFLSSSVGGWFVCESEEETINKLYRIKETARTAIPWNKDKKLFDPNTPNSASLRMSVPGLLQHIDVSDPLGPMAAIIRPKMLRDMSAARDVDGSIITAIQKVRKLGAFYFGEENKPDPVTGLDKSGNQVLGTFQDYVMYTDGNPEDEQADFISPEKEKVAFPHVKGEGVRASQRSVELEKNIPYQEEKKLIYDTEIKRLEMFGLDSSRYNADMAYSHLYSGYDIERQKVQNTNVYQSSILSGNLATPLGYVSGMTQYEAGFNPFLYSNEMGSPGIKLNPAYLNLNRSTAKLFTGDYVQKSVLYLNGKPVTNQNYTTMKEINKKPGRKDVSGDKLAGILTQSYIEGLQPTRGIQNAFPTYKMYIIKSDTSDYKFSSLDDYWDYRLVQDLLVVRDKNNPVHMLKARVVVDPRYISIAPDPKFRTGVDQRIYQLEESHAQVPVEQQDTEKEAMIFYKDKAPLRAGMRICIKMGYHSDPRYLDTVFIGTITQLNGSLDSGLYEISAEGDGRELTVPAVHFSDKFTGENYSDIINAIMRVNPNVIHFGKSYGSFIRRLSYGHKNLASLGMLGVGAFGAFGVGSVGTVTAGGAAAYAGKKFLNFSSATRITSVFLKGAPAAAALVAGGAVAAMAFPIAFGQFSQMSQFASPAFDELVSRSIIETDAYQDFYGYSHKYLRTGLKLPGWGAVNIPFIGELDGLLKGNTFNANKQAYQLAKHFYQTYKHGNNPLDDNIFCPDIWNSMTKRATLNINNKKSIWEVLQSVRTLYPNYALDIRPYGSRSTIFLGPIGFHYWRTDDPVQAMLPQINQMENLQVSDGMISKGMRKIVDKYSLENNQHGDSNISLVKSFRQGNLEDKAQLGLTRAPFIPFQKHHLVTSAEDIIMNGLKPTPERGYNSVVVTFGEDPSKVDAKHTIEFVADTDLYPESIIKRVIHVDFTDKPEVATRFALGYLKQGVERLYGGTIILRGNSKIEPYDKVYISDSVNKMYGWVQVETVIHKFDQEMGYTTHIVPNMVCEINNNAYLATQDIVMSTLYNKKWKDTLIDFGGSALIGANIGLAMGVLGVGISLPLLAGMFLVQGAMAFYSYHDSFEAGSRLVEEQKRMQKEGFHGIYPEMAGDEKTILQNIVSTSIQHTILAKGVKYGWAIGYLHRRAHNDYIHEPEPIRVIDPVTGKVVPKENPTIRNRMTSSLSNYESKIAQNMQEIKQGWKKTFGEDSPLATATHDRMIRGSARTTLSELEKYKFSDEIIADNPKLHDEFQAEIKKLQKSVGVDKEVSLTRLKNILGSNSKYLSAEITVMEGYLAELATSATKGSPSVTGSLIKAVGKTASGGWKLGETAAGKIFKSGAFAWMSMAAVEFIPDLGYSFAVKAVTKNNAMIVSPIFWRDSYLMPGLDGYMANDTFMHINDMLVNVNNSLREATTAKDNYLSQVFPIEGGTINKHINLPAIAPVDDYRDVMTLLGDQNIVKKVLIASGLAGSDMEKEFAATSGIFFDKWRYLSAGLDAMKLSIIPKKDMLPFLLALIYSESEFDMTKNSPSGALGLGQIVITNSIPLNELQEIFERNIKPYIPETGRYTRNDLQTLITDIVEKKENNSLTMWNFIIEEVSGRSFKKREKLKLLFGMNFGTMLALKHEENLLPKQIAFNLDCILSVLKNKAQYDEVKSVRNSDKRTISLALYKVYNGEKGNAGINARKRFERNYDRMVRAYISCGGDDIVEPQLSSDKSTYEVLGPNRFKTQPTNNSTNSLTYDQMKKQYAQSQGFSFGGN